MPDYSKKTSLAYYLSIAGGKVVRFISIGIPWYDNRSRRRRNLNLIKLQRGIDFSGLFEPKRHYISSTPPIHTHDQTSLEDKS